LGLKIKGGILSGLQNKGRFLTRRLFVCIPIKILIMVKDVHPVFNTLDYKANINVLKTYLTYTGYAI